jgi:5-methylcytosine-specific restriction endonuclease McrA
MSESHEVHRMKVGDGETEVEALCGFSCQLCETICEPGESLGFPVVGMEVPAEEVIMVCSDCFDNFHGIADGGAFDTAVEQAVERQKERRCSSPPYDEASEQALERDGYTCQICGAEGVPKTERGLAAFPVEAKNFHLDNLVTVCHECMKQDQAHLRVEAARAKEWVNAKQDGSEVDGETA